MRELPGQLSADELAPLFSGRTRLMERLADPRVRGAEPEVLAELERLNAEYEEVFGFRYVTFVAARVRAATNVT